MRRGPKGFRVPGGGQPTRAPRPGGPSGPVVGRVNNPPLSGPHSSGANAAKYVEVLVAVVQPTYFMNIFGTSSEVITARAVATNLSGGRGRGWLLTPCPPRRGPEG